MGLETRSLQERYESARENLKQLVQEYVLLEKKRESGQCGFDVTRTAWNKLKQAFVDFAVLSRCRSSDLKIYEVVLEKDGLSAEDAKRLIRSSFDIVLERLARIHIAFSPEKRATSNISTTIKTAIIDNAGDETGIK